MSEGPEPQQSAMCRGVLMRGLVPSPEEPCPRLLLLCVLKDEMVARTLDSLCYRYAEACEGHPRTLWTTSLIPTPSESTARLVLSTSPPRQLSSHWRWRGLASNR